MGISDNKENTKPSPATPLPSSDEKLNDLQKEIHQMSVERETFKLEMMSAEAMISILQSRIDALFFPDGSTSFEEIQRVAPLSYIIV
ncbi:unnamed protein product [Eruca vesicaria subsp. sativa]|uniref:Uncharacterized protein n=1 Tax=Eruca vesicaria subsp. sativa TaxID=29727 RepID=A0ABC8J4S6_ERUVS|nr:unnamed protein product [Eruca vesicaria subsp. sativa]